MEVQQHRVVLVQEPVRLPGQKGAALRLGDHGPVAVQVHVPLQEQVGGIVVKVVDGEPWVRPAVCEGGGSAAVAVKEQGVYASRASLLQRGLGQAGAEGGVICLCDAVLQLMGVGMFRRHGASSFVRHQYTQRKRTGDDRFMNKVLRRDQIPVKGGSSSPADLWASRSSRAAFSSSRWLEGSRRQASRAASAASGPRPVW